MGVKDIFGVNWTGALLHRILAAKQPGFAGILSTLHAGDRLIAVHMGMRSHSVWHYWFPTYDREASKFSPGIILLLRMAEAAQGLGVRSIDLGKGETLYKDRLASDAVALIEGRISLPSLASSLFQFRQASERWIRCTPFGKFARYPGHIVKRTEKWLRFR
jgi:CelD/BcsL family acetyltransferase involved in cellulose biosynthesis